MLLGGSYLNTAQINHVSKYSMQTIHSYERNTNQSHPHYKHGLNQKIYIRLCAAPIGSLQMTRILMAARRRCWVIFGNPDKIRRSYIALFPVK